jgi:hypothetical protein
MSLEDLLRSTHRLEDLSSLCRSLGYEAWFRELPSGAFPGGERAAILADSGGFAWYGVAGAGGALARKAARSLAARGLPAAVLHLDPSARRVSLAALDARPLDLSLDAPDPLDLARLERCAAREQEAGLATALRIAEALSGRGVDQRFFSAFSGSLQSLIGALPGRIPLAERHALALLQLTRILFLYFVEAKGWLAGRPRFLREEVDRCLAAKRSLHRDLLQPLFFGSLNRPYDERGRLARRFGPVPFLNGGLFEPHPLERRWGCSLPTPVLRDAFDTLFERFHFTLSSASDESIAPDMLGRVFERVMEPGERHATGSYYTPAALVDSLLRDGLTTWLQHQGGISWSAAHRAVDHPDRNTRRAFATIRLLDPAVGSGAFLLGALRLLAGAGVPGQRRAARLRRVLATNLFGVDRNAAAVRLAELRLWLEVVAADPSERPGDVAPLPNLDALIRQGDSLIDPAFGLPLRPPDPARAAALSELRGAVIRSSGAAKRRAVASLLGAERDIAATALRGAVASADEMIAEILEAARSPTLFGGRQGLDRAARGRLRELRAMRGRARSRVRALERAAELPWFHYPTHFADVFARGGFDLVAGNPPWVRAEALAPEQRRYLADRFHWFRGVRSGAAGYAHQPDLSVAFVERALELLRAGGVAALLLPAKLATTSYATIARGALVSRTTLALAADLRHDPRAGFDATVYPMALVAALAPPPEGHRVRLALGAEHPAVPQRALSGAPWALHSDAARNALERLRRSFPALGERFTCHLGVKTGCNQVFLDPPDEIEPELIRWAVRGRDVRAFTARSGPRLLWPCDPNGVPLGSLPPLAAGYVARHAAALRRRADHTGGHPWTLFRTRAASAPFRVVWSDLARRLEAAALIGRSGLRLIPLNTCYIVAVRDASTALRLTAWLNSTWCRAVASATADSAAGGFARFNARVMAALPCPDPVATDPGLLELGQRGARLTLPQETLDDWCAELLSLSTAERAALTGLARSRALTGR